jgi:hypothetical protein
MKEEIAESAFIGGFPLELLRALRDSVVNTLSKKRRSCS